MTQVQVNREMLLEALEELPEERWFEVLDFIGYLRWRTGEAEEAPDQDWFWGAGWQAAYQEAKQDLKEGRYEDFDNIEALIADLRAEP